MNANEDIRSSGPEDIVELGVASVETKGGVFETGEHMGLNIGVGISEE
ncbi:benenodin family lasso peptide [Luteimonas granuli]|nr:benenodin family lasso peptide [Luteimonas granuli]